LVYIGTALRRTRRRPNATIIGAGRAGVPCGRHHHLWRQRMRGLSNPRGKPWPLALLACRVRIRCRFLLSALMVMRLRPCCWRLTLSNLWGGGLLAEAARAGRSAAVVSRIDRGDLSVDALAIAAAQPRRYPSSSRSAQWATAYRGFFKVDSRHMEGCLCPRSGSSQKKPKRNYCRAE